MIVVWIIWFDNESGNALGPSVPFGTNARVGYAVKTELGWQEISRAKAELLFAAQHGLN